MELIMALISIAIGMVILKGGVTIILALLIGNIVISMIRDQFNKK